MKSKNLKLITATLVAAFATACSATRPAEPFKCAMVGAGIGGLGGVAVGASLDDDDHDTTENSLIGAGAGAVAGAITGYAICAVMPEEAPVTPTPPPPAPPTPVVKKTVVLPGVHFAFDRADLSAEAKQILDREIVVELKADPTLSVLVEGHTDNVGSDDYNQRLSEQRAGSVKTYLVGQGIDAGRVDTRGYGESRPVADNSTPAGRTSNRRVEVKQLQ